MVPAVHPDLAAGIHAGSESYEGHCVPAYGLGHPAGQPAAGHVTEQPTVCSLAGLPPTGRTGQTTLPSTYRATAVSYTLRRSGN